MQIKIGSATFENYDPGIQAALVEAYRGSVRPRCLCVAGGIELYIARIGERFILKRMPMTGSEHNMHCDSYEAPPELTGAAQLAGSAIKEDVESGQTDLRLDFNLTKRVGAARGETSANPKKTAKSDGRKLTLRGLLHYLWEEAGFNRWTPAMAGKRNWAVIRRYLLEAMANKNAKNLPLMQQIYVPELFNIDKKLEIEARRLRWFSSKQKEALSSGTTQLYVVIAPFKHFEKSRFGHRMVLKHLSEMPFVVHDDLYRRFYKRFADEILLLDSKDSLQGIVIATFSYTGMKTAVIEEAALMVVNSHFLPIENSLDFLLVEQAIEMKRKLLKPLRYNMDETCPMPGIVLTDTPDKPTAIYISSPEQSPDYLEQRDQLIAESKLNSILWDLDVAESIQFPETA